MEKDNTNIIPLTNVVEGDEELNKDILFIRLCDYLTVIERTHEHLGIEFDLDFPPIRPLVICDRLGKLFAAHPRGFVVADTILDLASARHLMYEDDDSDTVIDQKPDSFYVDVKTDSKVLILALSNDSAVLAVVAPFNLKFFDVPSLLRKESSPACVHSLLSFSCAKDFKWQKNDQNSYLYITSEGFLYRGHNKDRPRHIMSDIDAVEWSLNGDHIAVATKDTIQIFSSDFSEHFSPLMSFQLWSTESRIKNSMKVDTIEWVRDDSLVVGCLCLNEDGTEEDYIVQVIMSGDHKFTQSSIAPKVFSFPHIFENIMKKDIFPKRSGPYFLASYMDCWELLIVTNKKNIDKHIVLLKYWVGDGKKEVVKHEFHDDYLPTIPIRDDDARLNKFARNHLGPFAFASLDISYDNMILGFGMTKKVGVLPQMYRGRYRPEGALFCLTIDGKLLAFYLARSDEIIAQSPLKRTREEFETS